MGLRDQRRERRLQTPMGLRWRGVGAMGLLFCLLVLLGACPGPVGEDIPEGGTPESRVEGREGEGEVRPVGPLDQPLQKGETRAGPITRKASLIGGPQAAGKVGDWKLYNERVAFVIHGVGPSRSWGGRGGHIIDASPVEAGGRAPDDLLEELFPVMGLLRVARAQKIELVEAGGVGKRALIRVTADDVGIPIIDTVLSSRRLGLKIEIDYILQPEASHLEIVTRIHQNSAAKKMLVGDGVLFGDRTRVFAPGLGFDLDKLSTHPVRFLAGAGREVSYLLLPAAAKGTLRIPISEASLLPAMGAQTDPDQKVAEYRRFLLVSAGPLEGVLRQRQKLDELGDLLEWKGTVQGAPEAEKITLSLLAKGTSRLLSQTRPAAGGAFSFRAPAGEYEVEATAPGFAPVKVALQSGQSATLTLTPPAWLVVKVREKGLDGKDQGPIPARLQLSGPASRLIEHVDHSQKIPLVPGEYTVLVSRGLEYNFWQKKETLTSGKTTQLQVTLERAVDTKGAIGADLHLHASPSIDSELPLEERIKALVAEGVQFAAATDHDTFTDYLPLLQKLGLEPWLRTIVGCEISPLQYHFNAFPLQLPADSPAFWGVPFAEYQKEEYLQAWTGPQIWKFLRERYKAPIVQINHPRRGQAYFDAIGYSPQKGLKALKKGLFDTNWDVLEIYNGSGRDDFLNKVLYDWFSLLNQGIRKTATANSDSHTQGARPGLPRNMIASSQEKGDKIEVTEVIANLKAGRNLVYAGPYITAKTPQGKGPGDVLVGSRFDLEVVVQAPPWMPVSYVHLYANGKLLKKFDLPAATTRFRFQKMIRLEPATDTWYVLLAGDEKETMKPVYPSRKPVSMTNPLFVDRGGDGFDPPGLP